MMNNNFFLSLSMENSIWDKHKQCNNLYYVLTTFFYISINYKFQNL